MLPAGVSASVSRPTRSVTLLFAQHYAGTKAGGVDVTAWPLPGVDPNVWSPAVNGLMAAIQGLRGLADAAPRSRPAVPDSGSTENPSGAPVVLPGQIAGFSSATADRAGMTSLMAKWGYDGYKICLVRTPDAGRAQQVAIETGRRAQRLVRPVQR
jgi:hypothetical protein